MDDREWFDLDCFSPHGEEEVLNTPSTPSSSISDGSNDVTTSTTQLTAHLNSNSNSIQHPPHPSGGWKPFLQSFGQVVSVWSVNACLYAQFEDGGALLRAYQTIKQSPWVSGVKIKPVLGMVNSPPFLYSFTKEDSRIILSLLSSTFIYA